MLYGFISWYFPVPGLFNAYLSKLSQLFCVGVAGNLTVISVKDSCVWIFLD